MDIKKGAWQGATDFLSVGKVIEFLRFVGLVNAAVWFGSALFHSIAVAPVAFSEDMSTLLGPSNSSYFAAAVSQLYEWRFFLFHLVCAAVAVLHAVGEWVYLGKPMQRMWLYLLGALIGLNLLSGLWLQPKLKQLNVARHAVNYTVDQRRAAGKSYSFWNGSTILFDVVVLAGVGVYFWRIVNPTQATRFVSAVKFRS